MKFKESGLEYLGKIPEYWELRKLKYLSKKIIGGGTPDTSNSSYWTDEKQSGLLWVSIEDITNSNFITDTKKYITQSGLKFSSAKIIPPFSILYSIYASLGKIAYSNKSLTTNQAILAIIPNDLLLYKFLFYYLQRNNHITALSNTTTQNNINLSIIVNLPIPLPPLQEQKAIADYLDTKCELIANFIEKKEKFISLLKEKKQALINEVISKGLNKSVKFKESGLEYLGKIPEHWELRKLKHLTALYTGDSIKDNDKHKYCVRNNSIPYISTKDINLDFNSIDYDNGMFIPKYNTNFKRAYKNSTLLCIEGANAGKKIAFLNQEVCFVNKLCCISDKSKNFNSKALFYFFQSSVFKNTFFANIKGIIGGVTPEQMKDIQIPLPPLQEQKAIADYLDTKITKIDQAIEKIQKQIVLMKAYKSTLINEVVCGRKAVKEKIK